jgi:tRNA nucleotidyltransferase (CCA-adding enzyme)
MCLDRGQYRRVCCSTSRIEAEAHTNLVDIILCHTTADFDTLGAAVGATRLWPGAKIVLTGGAHPSLKKFLALYRDEFPFIEARAVHSQKIRSLILVDAQEEERFGACGAWIGQAQKVYLFDHHPGQPATFKPFESWIEPVGSTCTIIAEKLQSQSLSVNANESTVMALGIHVDTGSLTYPASTARDALALAWLMTQGVNLKVVQEYVEGGLTEEVQLLLPEVLEQLVVETHGHYRLGYVAITLPQFTVGLSALVSSLVEMQNLDLCLFVAGHQDREVVRHSLIGRSRIEGVNLGVLFSDYGGGGHAQAASAQIKGSTGKLILKELKQKLLKLLPSPVLAKTLMSSPVRTVRPECTIQEAQRVLLRYGHSGLPVVDETGALAGIVTRRDIDIALHHGFGHAPVKGYMPRLVRTITPTTPLSEIEELMVKFDIGRLPVMQAGRLVGIVSRTDVLRHLTLQNSRNGRKPTDTITPYRNVDLLAQKLPARVWSILTQAGKHADTLGLKLYLVGGAVRDVLLDHPTDNIDLDVVVELGNLETVEVPTDATSSSMAVHLAEQLKQDYPETRLEVYGRYQTATLLWPDRLMLDIATARTEFYAYPAANPEVESSSIRQDLYRRDFTINAMAICLNGPEKGVLLDFFGGLEDLEKKQVRILHANSFIEDPTRIFRAVRFATRLQFELEPQTESLILYALQSGFHDGVGGDRLKTEVRYILESDHWLPALKHLDVLGALRCIHPKLEGITQSFAFIRQLSRMNRWWAILKQQIPESNRLQHPWLLRLELILSTLSLRESLQVAGQLNLSGESFDRLEQLFALEEKLEQALKVNAKASVVYGHLEAISYELLLLLVARASLPLRRVIHQYLKVWKEMAPLLTGNDLKNLGLKPGPAFKNILATLREKQLDGELENQDDAIAFVLDPSQSALGKGKS